jgi:hypothetical protein
VVAVALVAVEYFEGRSASVTEQARYLEHRDLLPQRN